MKPIWELGKLEGAELKRELDERLDAIYELLKEIDSIVSQNEYELGVNNTLSRGRSDIGNGVDRCLNELHNWWEQEQAEADAERVGSFVAGC